MLHRAVDAFQNAMSVLSIASGSDRCCRDPIRFSEVFFETISRFETGGERTLRKAGRVLPGRTEGNRSAESFPNIWGQNTDPARQRA